MIVERLLLIAGLPDGLVPAVRDCILYSQAVELGGLAMLKRDFELLQAAKPAAMSVSPEPGALVLNAANQHAWIVAPAMLDLALADFRGGGVGQVSVQQAVEAPELRVVQALAGRFCAEVEVFLDAGQITARVTAERPTDADGVLNQILKTGMSVPISLWRELYQKSHEALAPDSIVSRRHAGPVMVDEGGRIHGRDDDDTDFALLGVMQPKAAPENA